MIKSLSFNSHLLVMLGNFGLQNSRRATSHGFLFCLKDQTITKMKKDARLRVDSELDGSLSLRAVPPTLIAAEKEEAKAVLTLFFKKQGLSNAVAARIINKSELFIDHLVSRLHSVHKSRYLVGRELTTLEIRDALIPYLESLLEEHGSMLADVVESFPHPPIKDKPITLVSPPDSAPDSKQVKAVSRVTETSPAGMLRPQVVYLMELGMDLEKIKLITRRFPAFAYYSLEGKIKPVVEFLLELGVPKSDIPIILVIYRFPALLTYSRQKFKTTVDFLYEMGLSSENVGKVLTRCPTIISYSVEDKLRPTAKYFRSLGADVSLLLLRCPQTFGLSIEANLKPVTQFFIERGYTLEEIGTMISRYGALYTFSLADNLIPKWDFFLTMDYSKSELVKFPQYFGYSLEERIKPRIALVKKAGVRLLLNQILSLSSRNFENALEKKMQQQQQLTDQV
ncbi:hypothetical protein ES319_D10G077700v1 [Gossypium barbadense]|uniref:Transcription termination factor MTERF5, chloroplastic n=2 Tax=Gossypium barbadense TaxID=3634 RepID=A0A5J5PMV2_GOSBA|nr:hypothetical protein ES319_D10G077700v1 [Gossypium barbadense]